MKLNKTGFRPDSRPAQELVVKIIVFDKKLKGGRIWKRNWKRKTTLSPTACKIKSQWCYFSCPVTRWVDRRWMGTLAILRNCLHAHTHKKKSPVFLGFLTAQPKQMCLDTTADKEGSSHLHAPPHPLQLLHNSEFHSIGGPISGSNLIFAQEKLQTIFILMPVTIGYFYVNYCRLNF